MSHWYQKECTGEELFQVLSEVGLILENNFFDCEHRVALEDRKRGTFVFQSLVERLSLMAAESLPLYPRKFTVESGKFIWMEGIEGKERYCFCRETPSEWLVEVGGGVDLRAKNLGWQRLSYEHPLADIVAIGPSQNICRND